MREFQVDNLSDRAAALTYYSVLSIFPALLVVISLVDLAGPGTIQTLLANLGQVAPGSVNQILATAHRQSAADPRLGWGAGPGQLGRRVVAGVPVHRRLHARLQRHLRRARGPADLEDPPIRIGVTVVVMVLLAVSAVAVVATGGLAARLGRLLGIGSTAVTVWDIAKWPVLLLIVGFMFALLYWASPNARQPFRWVTPGGILAVVVWVVASAASRCMWPTSVPTTRPTAAWPA